MNRKTRKEGVGIVVVLTTCRQAVHDQSKGQKWSVATKAKDPEGRGGGDFITDELYKRKRRGGVWWDSFDEGIAWAGQYDAQVANIIQLIYIFKYDIKLHGDQGWGDGSTSTTIEPIEAQAVQDQPDLPWPTSGPDWLRGHTSLASKKAWWMRLVQQEGFSDFGKWRIYNSLGDSRWHHGHRSTRCRTNLAYGTVSPWLGMLGQMGWRNSECRPSCSRATTSSKPQWMPTTSKDFGFGFDRRDGGSRSSEEHEKHQLWEGEKMDGRSGGKPPGFAKSSTTYQKPLGHWHRRLEGSAGEQKTTKALAKRWLSFALVCRRTRRLHLVKSLEAARWHGDPTLGDRSEKRRRSQHVARSSIVVSMRDFFEQPYKIELMWSLLAQTAGPDRSWGTTHVLRDQWGHGKVKNIDWLIWHQPKKPKLRRTTSFFGDRSFCGWSQLTFAELDKFGKKLDFFWSSLQHPKATCPSVCLSGIQKEEFGFSETTFCQGHNGGAATKPTTMARNLELRPEEHRMKKTSSTTIRSSSELSRWAPGVMNMVAEALLTQVVNRQPRISSLSWEEHLRHGHIPFRRDCLVCQQSLQQQPPHRRVKHPLWGVLSIDTTGPFIYDAGGYKPA